MHPEQPYGPSQNRPYGTGPIGRGGALPGQYPSAPQPGPPMPERAPNNRMALSVLSTIFGFLPLGVVAIVKSSQVDGLWARGDRGGAVRAADSAKKFAIWAFVVGVALVLAVVLLYVVIVGIFITRLDSYSSSITTTATSTVPSAMTRTEIDAQIRSASYGDCFHRVSSGGNLSIFAKVSCSQYAADVKVTDVTISTSRCRSNWVRSTSDSSRTPTQVVLCLTTV